VHTPTIDLALLRELDFGCELDEEALAELAAKAHVEHLPARRKLFVRGQEDNWAFFLLAGELELTTPEQPPERLRAGTSSGRRMLAAAGPRRNTAQACTAVEFLRLDRDLIELLCSSEKLPLYSVDEVTDHDEDAGRRLMHCIIHDYLSDRLVIPSLPDVALRIGRAINDPDVSILHITRILQSDPGVTARIIQVANSPLYRSEELTATPRQAIERLGLNLTRNLALSFVLQQQFRSTVPGLNRAMREAWVKGSRTAAVSLVLARHRRGLNPERAMLAGMLHNIGIFPMLAHCDPFSELHSDTAALVRVLNEFAPQVGAMVLRKWELGEDLVRVALESHIWRRDPERHPDLADVVLVARVHQLIGTPLLQRLPALDTLPAVNKVVGTDGGPQGTLRVIEEARQELRELEQLLVA